MTVFQRREKAVSDVFGELLRASSTHGAMRGPHEGYAVLLEEVDELWDAIKRNDKAGIEEEAVQVAAMAVRFLVDVVYHEDEPDV